MHSLIADLQDFNSSVITITFDADEDAEISEVGASIPIINDVINEAVEQLFVIQLSLVSSLNPARVDTSDRSASLGRIIDNDRKYNFDVSSSFHAFVDQVGVIDEGSFIFN